MMTGWMPSEAQAYYASLTAEQRADTEVRAVTILDRFMNSRRAGQSEKRRDEPQHADLVKTLAALKQRHGL